MIEALLHPRAYPHPTGPIHLLETHISWVLLTGAFAYKVKKPVNLGFLDFSTLERRWHFCREELRLNQRLAPELYLDLVTIHGPSAQARLAGPGPVIEVAVRMRQFEQAGLLPMALAAGAVQAEHLEAFAERLAAFHATAAVAPPDGAFGTPEAVVAPALANLEVLRQRRPGSQTLARLSDWTEREARRLEGTFSSRLARGRVREGHGDLHLGNLVLHQGAVVGFDCLEFNPSLRWIDVLSDVAFLAMDLERHDRAVWSGRLLNRWLITCGDYGGLRTWRWYRTYRALVRAKVLALRLEQLASSAAGDRDGLEGPLRRYLDQAEASASTGQGALLFTHGVSGSGKSAIARQLCQRHGWIHLRSDVERRRLFGRWGTALGPLRDGDPYAAAITDELYGQLLPEACEAALEAGLTVVVDATFLRRSQRADCFALAARLGVPSVLLHCEVSLAEARRRLSLRQSLAEEPSEATLAVLERQWLEREPLSQAERDRAIPCDSLAAVEERLAARLKTTQTPLPPGCSPEPPAWSGGTPA